MFTGLAPRGLLKNPPFHTISNRVGPGRREDPQPLYGAVEGTVGGEVETGVRAGASDPALPLRHIHHPHIWTLEAAGRMSGWSANGLANSANNIIT